MVRQTSLEAFVRIRPRISPNQRIVLDVIEKSVFGITNMEIAVFLGWSVNRVTPRVNELVIDNRVFSCCVRNCFITGYKAHAWKAD